MTDFVNLTPHSLTIHTAEGGTIEIPPTMADCARCGAVGMTPDPAYADQIGAGEGQPWIPCPVCKGFRQVPIVARVVLTANPETLPPLVVETECGRFCPECTGNVQDMGSCGHCGGNGWIPVTVSIPRVQEAEGRVEGLPARQGIPVCPVCRGRGSVGPDDPDCAHCGGSRDDPATSETIYIVSRVVADHLDCRDRSDVWSPGELIRAAPGLHTAEEEGILCRVEDLANSCAECSGAWEAVELLRSLIAARVGQPIGCKGLRR